MNKNNYKVNRNNIRFAIITVILVLVIAFSFAGTVMSRTDFDTAELEGYYRTMEEQLTKDTRAYLNSIGYENSGVMVTRVVNIDGTREYKVTVHHSDINRLNADEREVLASKLAGLCFEDERCSFYHDFLVTE